MVSDMNADMKEIIELKEKLIVDRARWMRLDTANEQLLHDLMDLIIGITEHLENQENSTVPEIPCIRTDGSCLLPCRVADEVARKAMINALKWVMKDCDGSEFEMVRRRCRDKIEHIEKGGEL